jgi:3-dehydroquinate synthase
MQQRISFPSGTVSYEFGEHLNSISRLLQSTQVVVVTDQNIGGLYPELAKRFKSIVFPAGEAQKQPEILSAITEQLLALEAGRKHMLVGVGGGVITDITGFAASVYMRGLSFGFVPTSLLAMVDAAVGGKNGINYGVHKNMLGTIRQPEFILFDMAFLKTLPDEEWSNGFAEIIKYACLFDKELFDELSGHDLSWYQHNPSETERVIRKCIDWKNRTVLEDEQEKGLRKLLNFGHTAGHALENTCHISHGQAVAIGMMIACRISETINGLSPSVTETLGKMLRQYRLPTWQAFNAGEILEVLKMDKKRTGETIDYILLNDIGKAEIRALGFDIIYNALKSFADARDR